MIGSQYPVNLPNKVTALVIGSQYPVNLPNKVTELVIGSQYPVNLPNKVTELVIGSQYPVNNKGSPPNSLLILFDGIPRMHKITSLLPTMLQSKVFSFGSYRQVVVGWVLLYVHRNRRFIRDRSPGRPPRLSHSSWALRWVINICNNSNSSSLLLDFRIELVFVFHWAWCPQTPRAVY